ncbi:hypothetical protein FB451DRAFT_1365186, partial [Mycena latifolia]
RRQKTYKYLYFWRFLTQLLFLRSISYTKCNSTSSSSPPLSSPAPLRHCRPRSPPSPARAALARLPPSTATPRLANASSSPTAARRSRSAIRVSPIQSRSSSLAVPTIAAPTARS